MGGEAAHVHPNLCDQYLRRSAVDAGDGAKERHLLGERGDHPLYLFAKARYGLIEVIDVGQYVPGHEGVVIREVPFEGLFERWDLRAQRSPLANSAKTSGSVVPLTSASIIARAEAPSTRVATEESLMPASWSIFSRRWTSSARSCICFLR